MLKYTDLLIPANVTNMNGKNNVILTCNNKKVAVINLIGKVCMGENFEQNISDPFKVAAEQLDIVKKENL